MHLIWHIVKNDIDSVRMMLQSGIDVNVTYSWNSKDTFSPVLTNAHKKIEIDQEYQCLALNIAVLGGYYDMTRLLLSAGADINKRDGRGRYVIYQALYL
jgi:ankyrin repeat protein